MAVDRHAIVSALAECKSPEMNIRIDHPTKKPPTQKLFENDDPDLRFI
jgi:hypothetical protein